MVELSAGAAGEELWLADAVDKSPLSWSSDGRILYQAVGQETGNNLWIAFPQGNEIGDLCADFDNFTTINGHRYVTQSEYSDVNHLCVSGRLTSDPQTPQGGFGS